MCAYFTLYFNFVTNFTLCEMTNLYQGKGRDWMKIEQENKKINEKRRN